MGARVGRALRIPRGERLLLEHEVETVDFPHLVVDGREVEYWNVRATDRGPVIAAWTSSFPGRSRPPAHPRRCLGRASLPARARLEPVEERISLATPKKPTASSCRPGRVLAEGDQGRRITVGPVQRTSRWQRGAELANWIIHAERTSPSTAAARAGSPLRSSQFTRSMPWFSRSSTSAGAGSSRASAVVLARSGPRRARETPARCL